MNPPRILAAALLLVLAGQAAAADGIARPDAPPTAACTLHIGAALPAETRFGDDGSIHLVWLDSLDRRTEAALLPDGSLRLRLAAGGEQWFPPSPRPPDASDRARLAPLLALYRDAGVDLLGRRFFDPAQAPPPDSDEPGPVDEPSVIWSLKDACERAEAAARSNCSFECSREGMWGDYRPGNCGSGSTCTCVYYAEHTLQP